MTAKLRRPKEIQDSLREALEARRRDQLIFSGLTILLTPFFLAGAMILILLGIQLAGFDILFYVAYPQAIATGFMILFLLIILENFFGSSRKPDLLWAGIAGLVFIVLGVITYASPLAASNATLFWVLFGILGFFLLALLGHGYEPKDVLYIDAAAISGVDNPFSLEDDYERAHLGLGVMSFLPNMIVKAYSEIFGSLWIWKGLSEKDLSSAAQVIHFLAIPKQTEAIDFLAALSSSEAARILRVLKKMRYILIGKKGLFLNDEGEKLAGVNKWV